MTSRVPALPITVVLYMMDLITLEETQVCLTVPLVDGTVLRSMEFLADGKPVVMQSFHVHGSGYHTMCRWPDDEDKSPTLVPDGG